MDREAADEALGGDQIVIDIQTHYVADRHINPDEQGKIFLRLAESVAGDLFKGLDKLVRPKPKLCIGSLNTCVVSYLESETDCCGPIPQRREQPEAKDKSGFLSNAETDRHS